MCPDGMWQLGKAGSQLTRSGAPCVIGLGSILGFLWLILNWTQEQKLGKLPVVAEVPAIWAGCCRLWAGVLFAHTGWPCLCCVSHPGRSVLP